MKMIMLHRLISLVGFALLCSTSLLLHIYAVDTSETPLLEAELQDVPHRQLQAYNVRVQSLRLITADSNQAVLTITNGTVIDVATYLTMYFNIRALTGVAVGSVHFSLRDANDNEENDDVVYEYIDSSSPYSLCPSSSSSPPDVYPACSILAAPGMYTICVTAFSGANGTGVAGPPFQVTFQIMNSCRVPEVRLHKYYYILIEVLYSSLSHSFLLLLRHTL